MMRLINIYMELKKREGQEINRHPTPDGILVLLWVVKRLLKNKIERY